MTFGTARRRKLDVAEGVVLALAHVATRRGNRLGLLTFGEPAPVTLPPRQGRAGLLGVLQAVRREPAADGEGATSLGSALRRLGALAQQRAFVAIVSDFRGPRDWRGPLIELAGRHDVLCVEVRDPREQELPDVGPLVLVDPETGRQLRVDTSRRSLRERFARAADEERRDLATAIASAGVDQIVLSTDEEWLQGLLLGLRTRGGGVR
jgi:uncharacterized protein (DUF58 family)